MTGQAKDESVIELGDSVPAPLGFNAFGPECLFYAGKHWSGGQGSAGMRPERRLQRRNGGAAHSPPQNETQKTPPDISLLRAKNGLDNGVHLRGGVDVRMTAICIAVPTRISRGRLSLVRCKSTRKSMLVAPIA